jgi:hypothetical protein
MLTILDDGGLRPIKEVMGRNLIDRSVGFGYGALGSATTSNLHL